jgi:hypothetical protein
MVYSETSFLQNDLNRSNGVVKMQSTVRQTIFQVEPLKNIVGIGNTTAYHIVVTPGANLGTLGIVTVPAYAEICNDPIFDLNSANESGGSDRLSWLRRALATRNF